MQADPTRTTTTAATADDQDQKQNQKRSNVRINVTYGMAFVYGISATVLMGWLLWKGRVDLALGVFSSIASVTTGIMAFWFGSRAITKKGETPS